MTPAVGAARTPLQSARLAYEEAQAALLRHCAAPEDTDSWYRKFLTLYRAWVRAGDAWDEERWGVVR